MAGKITVSTINDSSGVLATQNGMTGIAKAWVNFAGSTGTINNSFNVSSITRNGTGDYTISFTTAMPNANYVTTGMQADGTAGGSNPYLFGFSAGAYGKTVSITTTSIRMYSTSYNNTPYDAISNFVAILGN